jgi:hypothetical protein
MMSGNVKSYYNRFMGIIRSMQIGTGCFQVNVPKCFYNQLEPVICKVLESQGHQPTQNIQSNSDALQELALFKDYAVHAKLGLQQVA